MPKSSKNKKGPSDLNESLDSVDSISEDQSSTSSTERTENSKSEEKTREETKSQTDRKSAGRDPKAPRSSDNERRGSYYTDEDTVSSSSGTWDRDEKPTLESPGKEPVDGDVHNGSLLKQIEETGAELSSHESEDSLRRYQEILQEQYVQEIAAKEGKSKEKRKEAGRRKNYKLVRRKR